MSRISAIDEQVFVLKETLFAQVEKPASADAIKVRESSIDVARENRVRDDKTSSRSVLGAVAGRGEGTFTIRAYLLGSGTNIVPPDYLELFENGMGIETIGGSDVSYTLKNAIFGDTINIHRHVTNFAQIAIGAFVNDIAMEFSGTEEAQVTFSGICADVVHVGAALANEPSPASSNEIDVDAGDGKNFEVGNNALGGIYSIGVEDDRQLTTIATDTLTFDGVAWTPVDDDVLKPYAPTATLQTTSPLFGSDGSFTIAAGGPQAVACRTKSVNLNNNAALRADEFGTIIASCIGTNEKRSITADLSFWLTSDPAVGSASLLKLVHNARNLTALQYQIVTGSAGNRVTVTVPEMLIELPGFTFPNAGDVEVNVTGVGVDSAGAEGELTVKFD